jgi:DNA (cytosine-5)-methyltransferase 1
MDLTSVEICSGAGGQALGLERAGFEPVALVEVDPHACATLRYNRPQWNVIEQDLHQWSGKEFHGVDLLAGGVPCPPFSKAGKQLGSADERDLFPKALELVHEIRPQAVMLENVRGLLDAAFTSYRARIDRQLLSWGYTSQWRLLQAADFGVSQLRPRVVCVALKTEYAASFQWPEPLPTPPPSVGELLQDLMAEKGWVGAAAWAQAATTIAPTLVGGSKKHGGPDLGPTRARAAWAALGVEGRTLAEQAPEPDFVGNPRLTVRMAARVQGFPDDWHITGRKTNAYRQVGNAFPPPVAAAVAGKIRQALAADRLSQVA